MSNMNVNSLNVDQLQSDNENLQYSGGNWGSVILAGGADMNEDIPYRFLPTQPNSVIVVGRLTGIERQYVSKIHFVIQNLKVDQSTEPIYILDNLSGNGTYVNDVKVRKDSSHVLRHNDQISIKRNGVEQLIFFFRINTSHGRSIRKRNLDDPNDSEEVRQVCNNNQCQFTPLIVNEKTSKCSKGIYFIYLPRKGHCGYSEPSFIRNVVPVNFFYRNGCASGDLP